MKGQGAEWRPSILTEQSLLNHEVRYAVKSSPDGDYSDCSDSSSVGASGFPSYYIMIHARLGRLSLCPLYLQSRHLSFLTQLNLSGFIQIQVLPLLLLVKPASASFLPHTDTTTMISEIAIFEASAPDVDLANPKSPFKVSLQEHLRTMLSFGGAQGAYCGQLIENPKIIIVVINWDTLDAHVEATKSP